MDKTKLSSFGTEKGYPVLARCANLPVELRNGEGIGGGRLVGWLPIVRSKVYTRLILLKIWLKVKEDAGETGKKGYVNLKRVVWHESFWEILRSIQIYAKTGFKVICGDKVECWVFPFVVILSADYEEQYVLVHVSLVTLTNRRCVIALIRGVNSKHPCPICLIPGDQLSNLFEDFPLRSTADSMAVYEAAQNLNATDGDKLLKEHGLRDVKVNQLFHYSL